MTPSQRERLEALLQFHRAEDPEEETDRRDILALVRESQDPFDRSHYRPGHLTASAVVLHPREPRVALLHHRKLERWLQPGGHGDAGEADPFVVARREVLEELGLEATPCDPERLLDVDVHEIPARGSEPAHRHFDLRIAVRATTDVLAPSEGESGRVRWAGIEELSGLGVDHGLRRAITKVLASR